MLNNEKLILVIYYNIANIDDAEIPEILQNVSKSCEFAKDDSILFFLVPVYDSETRIECINPKLVSEDEYQQAKGACEKIKEILDKQFLNNE